MFDTCSFASRFLSKLSPGTINRRLTRIEPPGRHFVEEPLRGITVLADQQHLGVIARWVAQERDHSARPRMPDHLELTDRPVRKANGVDIQIDDATAIHSARRDARTLTHR